MGCCVGSRDEKNQNNKLALQIFQTIDIDTEQTLHRKNLSNYFKEYTDSYIQLLMNEIDLNQDGKITKKQWFAYWQYIRRSGYEQKSIRKALLSLQEGNVLLNFPKANTYKSGVPRDTLIKDIVDEIKDDQIYTVKLEP